MKAERALGAGCFALVALWLLFELSPVATPVKWDECLLVYDAQRLLDGQVPYRDFFNFPPPGIFLALGGWFRVWGGTATLTLGRFWALLVALGSWSLCARSLRRAGWGQEWALALAAFFPMGLYALWPVPSHHWLGTLVWLAALEAWSFDSGQVRGRWGWSWIGAMAGLELVILQTSFVEVAVFWGVLWLLHPGKKLNAALRASLGGVLTAGPVLGWLWAERAWPAMVRDTILWTVRSYGEEGGPNAVGLLADLPDRFLALWQRPDAVGRLPWLVWASSGSLVYGGLVCATGLALVLAIRHLMRAVRARTLQPPLTTAAAALTLMSLTLFLKGKTDLLHLVFVLAPVGVTWGLCGPPGWLGRAKFRRWAAAGLASALCALSLFHLSFLLYHRPALWEFTDVDRPTREAPVNRWLRAQPWLLPGDSVAAFPEGGQVYLYTRPAGVGYTLLLPLCDHYNTLADHMKVASQMDRSRPRCVILTTEREGDYLAPASPLAARLRRDYERLGTVADAVIYRRKEGS